MSILVQKHTRQQLTLKQKIRTILMPIIMVVFLSACTGVGLFKNEVTESLKNDAYSSSEFYVNKMVHSKDAETKQSYRLLAIRQLLNENKVVEAKNMFKRLVILVDAQRIEYKLLTAKLMAMEHKNIEANHSLKAISLSQLSHSQTKRYYNVLVKIAENKKNIIEAVRMRILLEKYLTNIPEYQQNNNNIWALLRSANKQMLSQTDIKSGEYSLAGWLSLIELYNDNLGAPEVLPQAINNWKMQYPNHSASKVLPTELKAITTFKQTTFDNIALLLPLSGDLQFLGDIIQQGFNDARGTEDMTTVNIFDTSAESLSSLIQKAQESGAQAIVGPLLKSKVDEMFSQSNIDGLSILTLNATKNSRVRTKVCYYGLAPETEAHSAANKIYKDNIDQVIVFAPNNDFGRRSANAFVSQWRKLTNNDANVRYYDQAADIVNKLQNEEGKALYFLGTADQLLEAKESLSSSHFANQFAIYSSSRSHSPNSNADFYITMNGVKFSEIPLLTDKSSQEYKKARKVAKNDYSMMRLYAMGADAWTLIHHFNELRQIPGFTISGLTGELKASVDCHVERGMKWLQYNGGSISEMSASE
ncbi:penicillin-binding protein activator [Pasteurella atlantica]|uniref:penicillin-binding protein activator n=1 Tax=Pasteurellaceae TaxID=712 RepID=UPI002778D57A|nr:penicillin-binding protein activator [Pasteurella atlantica]MDP8033045.1 penicillin-binding protein activator [Pasteurella atlantica]MDP8034982.1 penicillin-binding protein activator [Pasteurella atlantica]MDP8037058.1 penicillin-binding protein activator [Pasteurella atlantica]MDP8047416.1 penicillin-binding protein activator [Pasteurella atlantica]MDP8049085.1 penicillin-binding protein activator [Pasteurella atlantica]